MRQLAEKYHAGQFRKGEEKLPYIVHPQEVAETLLNWGEDENSKTIQIAWGHDLLEDTAASESEILAASDAEVLNGIKHLTRAENIEKSRYLEDIANCGIRDVLLVKISDRICNSKDFIKLKGSLYACQYLHEADCLIPALEKLCLDPVVKNALAAWNALDETLSSDARRDAIRGCLLGLAIVLIVSGRTTGKPGKWAAIALAALCIALALTTLPLGIVGLMSNFSQIGVSVVVG